MTALWVALGAAVGAPLRYLTDRAVQSRLGTAFPWGTFTVNVIGSFVLGVVLRWAPDPTVVAVLGIGFCGALTTYSTFGFETFRLLEDRRSAAAVANVVLSVVAGVAAAVLGFLVGGLLR
jgi:fluoride exporter